ncbi:GNAT family N-acetyltransferase [Phyllobacterium sp. 628]|uniref:GNAT family N-acetyltransferase n=1 Tax=Phyllobacterium sp. 628 TaxID=2718938 RepID=UPI001662359E|nr:GNAT family N-acetyltransferase [Phyllobacterium sp. 628]QND52652.1 GNAT family N-acetyltransferase [Phyllobacterium sp. 628]
MPLPQFEAKIVAEPIEAAKSWQALPEGYVCGPAQTADWFSLWQANVNRDCLVAVLSSAETAAFVLPLEISRSGPFSIATYPGGPHANCNFPAVSPAHPISTDDLNRLFGALHQVRPDIDLVALGRQLPQLGDCRNPLLQLPSGKNANVSLAIALGGDFSTVLERHSAKRKKKKHRSSARQYDEAGGFQIITAASSVETDAMLETYFTNKAERLAKAGISNTYEPAGIKNFFQQLFARHVDGRPSLFQLKALEVAGRHRAVLGKSYAGTQTFIDFIGIVEDELVSASPGEFLFYEDIEDSCATGRAIYSFGIGDEPYKRGWSDIETPTYDTQVNLTAKGKAYALYLTARRTAVRKIKSNDKVWAGVKKLRSRMFGRR